MINKKDLFRYCLLLITIAVSFLMVLISENPTIHVLGFWLSVGAGVLITKLDLTHPLFWFSSSFGLYSTGYSLIYILGYPANSGYSKENTLLALVALSVVVLVVGVKKYDSYNFFESRNYNLMSRNGNKQITEFILIVLLLVLLISVAILFRTPFNHKNEMLAGRNIFFVLGAYSARFLTLYISFYLLLFIDKDRRKTKFFMIFSGFAVILFSLFTGERDAMFRFLIVIIVSLFTAKKISKRMLMILVPIGMFALIVGRYFKYYFVSGITNTSIKSQSFIYNFLTSDFHAAGENLQILINNTWTESYHGFSLILIDLISPFIPGGYFENVGTWFNDTFYPGSYSRAFTLLGEGYVIGGTLGIIALFIILGVGIKILYKNSTKNIYWLVLYIYSIPTIITSFRSTLGTITIAIIRIALLSIAIHYIARVLIRGRIKSN